MHLHAAARKWLLSYICLSVYRQMTRMLPAFCEQQGGGLCGRFFIICSNAKLSFYTAYYVSLLCSVECVSV